MGARTTAGSGSPPVVFVHGLWLHAESWHNWQEYFRQHGYETHAVSWPGDGESAEATRRNPQAVAGFGVGEITNHIAEQLKRFPVKPVLIGHSFGGLLVQKLLGRDLRPAAIAIDPPPVRRVWGLPFSALRASFPVLGNPLNFSRAVSLTESQFRYGFANAVPEREAKELYARYAMPAPRRPLFQAATATFNPSSATTVNAANATRGPLLLVSGENDHIGPRVLVRSALRVYRKSAAVTDFKQFAGRGHSLALDHGWKELAEYSAERLGATRH